MINWFTIYESSIDYPQKDLPSDVWGKKGEDYILLPQVFYKIWGILDMFPDMFLTDIATQEDGEQAIHIVGSLCTNLYTKDSDLDVHIVVDDSFEYFGDEEYQEYVKKWFEDNRDEIQGYVGSHPVEVYLQYDANQDYLSDGCYNILSGRWYSGPKIAPANYDPYEDYSHVMKLVQQEAGEADKLLGELKRDVIDYDTIRSALSSMDADSRKRLSDKLESKLEDMEKDIERLYSKRKEWVDLRRGASKVSDAEEAKQDVEKVKDWNDKNAMVKFLSRYQYYKVIAELHDLMDDDKIDSDEVDDVKDIVGVKESLEIFKYKKDNPNIWIDLADNRPSELEIENIEFLIPYIGNPTIDNKEEGYFTWFLKLDGDPFTINFYPEYKTLQIHAKSDRITDKIIEWLKLELDYS